MHTSYTMQRVHAANQFSLNPAMAHDVEEKIWKK
jgi:hypothetical protein